MAVKKCEWTNQRLAFAGFAGFAEKTQSAGHIRPLHWYVACRLVLEGGFDPDHIKPRPPFRIGKKRKGLPLLHFDSDSAGGGEAAVLGGLKTKKVDVVVSRPGIGPVLAISCKGTTAAFRNLTNRMEELIGDCTNLHISYPTLVLGYLHLLRANRKIGDILEEVAELEESEEEEKKPTKRTLTANDLAFEQGGDPVAEIKRFHNAIERLAGRSGVRDDITRYEAIGLALVETEGDEVGGSVAGFPVDNSVLRVERFFDTLYAQHDERFVYGAPMLEPITRRLEWSPDSPALAEVEADYPPRLGTPKISAKHTKAASGESEAVE
jgi:hypothetical protein